MQLCLLAYAWRDMPHAWVTLKREDSRMLEGQRVFYAHGPTERNLPNLLRNIMFAWRLMRETRPKVIVTTGAGPAVPFAWVGRLFGAKIVYIESLTRIERPSLTYRLIRPVVSRTYVQWPELRLPGALYRGTVFDRA